MMEHVTVYKGKNVLDGVLALIRNTNEAMKLVSDGKSIEVLGDTLTKYRDLNKKICDMLK